MLSDRLVGVIGVGMVGGAMLQCFTEAGVRVIPYDKFRPGFNDESIHFEGFIDAEMVFVSVPTLTSEDGSQDLEPLNDVLKRLSKINYNGIVVSKCTTVPGVTRALAAAYPTLRIVHNPEFLTAAKAYEDFKFQKAAMISGPLEWGLEVAEFLRELFPKLTIRLFHSYETTEIAKYVHNCFLATKVSFMNEIFDICEHHRVNYSGMIEAVSLLEGIGESHLRVPGPDARRGYGGYCFPKDSKAFAFHAKSIGADVKVLDGAMDANKKFRGNG